MSAPENQVRPSTPQAHSNSVEQKSPVSYEVTVMCDRYNEILFNLFCVYAQSVNGELYHTIDDQLNLMQDYGVIPRYMTKDDVITCFNHIAEKRNDNSKIKTANCLKYPLSSLHFVVTKPLLSVSAESHSPFTRTQCSPRQATLLETKLLPSSKHGI
ncbi:hypothetical protein WA588_001740 [Blastocystis sp. NMH]